MDKNLPLPFVKLEIIDVPENHEQELENSFPSVITTHVVADNFDKLIKQYEGETSCPFCDDFSNHLWSVLRTHIYSKHYQLAVFCLIDNKQACILPCQRISCEQSQHKDGMHKSHYHCPICNKIFARSTAMKGHLYNVKILQSEQFKLPEHQVNEEETNTEATSISDNPTVSFAVKDEPHPENEASSVQDIVLEESYEDFLNKGGYSDGSIVIEIKQTEMTPKKLRVLKRKHLDKRSPSPVAPKRCTPAQNNGRPEVDVLDIFRMMPSDIETEDQLFAASLSAEMRHLPPSHKLNFKKEEQS